MKLKYYRLNLLWAPIVALILFSGARANAQMPTYRTPDALFGAMAVNIGCEIEVLLSRQKSVGKELSALPPDKGCQQVEGRWTLISQSQTTSSLTPRSPAPKVLLIIDNIPVKPSWFQVTIPPASKGAYDRDQIASQQIGQEFIKTQLPTKLKQHLQNMNVMIAAPDVVTDDNLNAIRNPPNEHLNAAIMQTLKSKSVDFYVRIDGEAYAAFLSGNNGWGLLGTYTADVVSVADSSLRTTADHYGVIMIMSPGAQ